jgi:hypothetical protein
VFVRVSAVSLAVANECFLFTILLRKHNLEYPSNPEKVDPVDGRPGRNRLGACRSIRLLRPATSSLLLNTNHTHPFPQFSKSFFSIRPILDTSL